MKLYFNPLACSLGSRIAAYEAGTALDFIQVDGKTKRAADGTDFRSVNPLGLVPALVLDDGTVLTENAAVLQYLAPAAGGPFLHQWLCFIGTELHKGFVSVMDKTAPPDVKAYALERLRPKLAHAAAHLAHRTWLLDDYSVADGYLFAVLNWTIVTPIKLTEYPALAAFHARMLERPAVKRAFDEERALYLAER
jgi:glutathione S-transferase